MIYPKAGGDGLRPRSLSDLLSADIPEREPLLGSWLTQRHLNMTYAPAGVGKSMFAMSVALAIAGGGSFLDWKAPKPRRVLIVDGEMDVLDLKDRAALLLKALPECDREAAGGNLTILAQQDQAAGVVFPDLADAKGRAAVLRVAGEHGAELVILDNFSTLATVEDENAASSFDPVMDLMRDLKQAGRACLLIHHAKKGGDRGTGGYRGTSKMAVIFNSILLLKHPGGIPSREGAAFDLVWEKVRSLRDATMAPLTVRLKHDVEGAPRWTWETGEDARMEEMVSLVRSSAFRTQADVAGALGVSTGLLSKLKGRAIGAGLISREEWAACLGSSREPIEGDGGGPQDF